MGSLIFSDELEKLNELNASERSAFLDLLVLGILADAKITDTELEQMDKELLKLPFLKDPEQNEIANAQLKKSRLFLEKNIHDYEVIDGFIRELSLKLIAPAHRTIALKMFVALPMADGTSDIERKRCVFLANCFGWGEAEVDAIQFQLS